MSLLSILTVNDLLQNNDGSQKISGDSLKNVYKSFVADYPIVSIEDPFDQDDWEHYAKMTAEVGQHVQIVGDDLLVTNPKVWKRKICWSKFRRRQSFDLILFIVAAACGKSNSGEVLQCPSVEGSIHYLLN